MKRKITNRILPILLLTASLLPAETFDVLFNFPSDQLGDGVSSVVVAKDGTIFAGLIGGGEEFEGAIVALVPLPGGSYNEKVLYSFTDSECGGPQCDANIIAGSSGALYGTVLYAGPYKMGEVFSLSPGETGKPWTYTVLYTFTGGTDSGQPFGGVVEGTNGALYGATFGPGYPVANTGQWGNVYELAPPSTAGGAWTYSSLHNFQGTDGGNPEARLVLGANGALYGTTETGGPGGETYAGVVFELVPPAEPGGTWTENILHAFGLEKGDGGVPEAPVTISSEGVIYGTTYGGGAANEGTVFALRPPTGQSTSWAERIIHSFNDANETDCFGPFLPVTIGPGGVLYGPCANGGIPANYGVIYSLTPPAKTGAAWTETLLTNFVGADLGANPSMGFVPFGGGSFITGTFEGGTAGAGTILKFIP